MAHPLPTAVLGRTGLEVTRLGYGAGHRKPMNNKERETILNAVLDSGVNLIDTAISYGNSEELIGRYISHRSSEFHVATKGHTWDLQGPAPRPPQESAPPESRLRRRLPAPQSDR